MNMNPNMTSRWKLLPFAILWPIAITMILSSLAVVFVKSNKKEYDGIYQEQNDHSNTPKDKLKINLINSSIIIILMIILTNLLLLLLALGCTHFINGYIILTTFLTLLYFGANFLITLLEVCGVTSLDMYSFLFILWNISATGIYAIFYKKGCPDYVTQIYQMWNVTLLTWNMSRYNKSITWILLMLLIVYDIIAVLTPCGALNQISNNHIIPNGLMFEYQVEVEVEETENDEPRYDSNVYTNNKYLDDSINRNKYDNDIHNKTNDSINYSLERNINDSNKNNKVVTIVTLSSIENINHLIDIDKTQHENDNKSEWESVIDNESVINSTNLMEQSVPISHIKLGLGDFIFFGLIASLGARESILCFILTYVAVLSGFYITCILLQIYRMPLPALPIPLILGTLAYGLGYCIDQIKWMKLYR